MLISLFEAYAPDLKLSNSEFAHVAKFTLHVGQHVYPLTVMRDVENTTSC